jgi:hypothetical protein
MSASRRLSGATVRPAQGENGTYIEHGTFAGEAQADSPLLPGLAIDIRALFAAGRA